MNVIQRHALWLIGRLTDRMRAFTYAVTVFQRINEERKDALKILMSEAIPVIGDAENFVVICFENAETGERYTMTIQKDGKLNPAAKWYDADKRARDLEARLVQIIDAARGLRLNEFKRLAEDFERSVEAKGWRGGDDR